MIGKKTNGFVFIVGLMLLNKEWTACFAAYPVS
jgi:hypothetical protein